MLTFDPPVAENVWINIFLEMVVILYTKVGVVLLPPPDWDAKTYLLRLYTHPRSPVMN